LARAIPRGVLPDAAYANRPDVPTCGTLSEGTTTARGVARIYAALAFRYSPARSGGVPTRPGSTFGMVGNGSTAYADIDTGVAIAVMLNRYTVGDLTAAARIDRTVTEARRAR
jgi:hypothetical protein